jgi:DNA-binding NtrC family response regulator
VACEPSAHISLLPRCILIVEDDESVGEYLVQAIEQETPYCPILVSSSRQALETMQQVRPDLLLLDYRLLSPINGIELYDLIHSTQGFEDIPAIIMSASLPQTSLEYEIKKRALIALPRPHDLNEFLAALHSALE